MVAKALSVLLTFSFTAAPAHAAFVEEMYALNSFSFGAASPAFERFFDAGAMRPELMRPQIPLPIHHRSIRTPFLINIPSVPPPSYQRTFHRLLKKKSTNSYDSIIQSQALEHGLDPRLVKSIIAAESEFTTHAKSPAGALGLMQIMPRTAASIGVAGKSLFDPFANIRAGTTYLAYLFTRAWKRYHLQGLGFDQAPDWLIQRVIAAYNAGPRFLARHHLYRQTREYIRKVLMFYRSAVADFHLRD